MNFPAKEIVQSIREQYPPGSMVELVSMSDQYTAIPPGTKGTVDHVDDTGTVFVRWDTGSHLGAIYGVDQIKLLVAADDAEDAAEDEAEAAAERNGEEV